MEPDLINIITLLLAVSYAIILLVLRRGWLAIPFFRAPAKEPLTRVSVLIAARNEEERLGLTIDDILAQDYPKHLMEVIIVDDHSTDRTAEIIASYADRGVTLLRMNEASILNSYKKKAITKAIHQATGELMVATDADCRMHSQWLRTVVSCYEEKGYKMISSPVVYFEQKSAFEELQTLEFMFLIGLGAATIGNGMPSTCNGANLAYRRDVFLELKGFSGIDDLASGDDELFLHKVASKYPDGIGFCKSPDAIVYTHAKPDLTEFIRQRKRWASKTTRYKNKSVVALGVSIWTFNVLVFVTAVMGFWNPEYWTVFATALLLKFLAELALLVPVATFARLQRLLWYHPVLTTTHIFYFIYIGIVGNSGKYIWKGRLVR